MNETAQYEAKARSTVQQWRADWNLFAREALGANLDPEQQAILSSVQHNRMTSVASGTARGKDFTAAVSALCFLYLTPTWNTKTGELVGNTKVALTAPTDRQVQNIMVPEFSRLFQRARKRGVDLPGRLVGYDIRTDDKEWYLTGFKADENQTEAWSGFHAVNTMFVVTEASGITEKVYNAIEGNLQGNSRMLIVFNPNIPTGYAAASQKSPRWHKFRLDSLNAPNVLQKKQIIPGQVDYEWVKDKVENWCSLIPESEINEGEGDFEWEGNYYRPNDLFRVKVRGMFPKVSSDVLIPIEWVQLANQRWKEQTANFSATAKETLSSGEVITKPIKNLRLGVDVAGMGRDSSAFCFRYDNYVARFRLIQSGGVANHMEIAGITRHELQANSYPSNSISAQAFIDTIGEGAGVFSRLEEQSIKGVHSVKAGAAPEYHGNELKDHTGQYTFKNLRAFLYWAVRDWLNPAHKTGAALPPDDELLQELTETKWQMRSDGKIEIEPKDELKKRLHRSPDKADSLALTFYPATIHKPRDLSKLFR